MCLSEILSKKQNIHGWALWNMGGFQNVEIALQTWEFEAVWSGVILETFIASPARKAESHWALSPAAEINRVRDILTPSGMTPYKGAWSVELTHRNCTFPPNL